MICKLGHQHPPMPVRVAADNPAPHPHGGPRPYHCPDCPEASKTGHRDDYWRDFADPAQTGRRPCQICF